VPKTESELTALLDRLDINYTLFRHPPLYTVEESQLLRPDMPGGHGKCLFVKDKKGRLGLFVVEESKRVDLKSCADRFGLGRLSFGSADKMEQLLGVKPGSVTPFALINCPATDKCAPPLIVALDQTLLDLDPVHFHPLHNEATLAIHPLDLLRFLSHLGHTPLIHNF